MRNIPVFDKYPNLDIYWNKSWYWMIIFDAQWSSSVGFRPGQRASKVGFLKIFDDQILHHTSHRCGLSENKMWICLQFVRDDAPEKKADAEANNEKAVDNQGYVLYMGWNKFTVQKMSAHWLACDHIQSYLSWIWTLGLFSRYVTFDSTLLGVLQAKLPPTISCLLTGTMLLGHQLEPSQKG